MGFRIFDKIKYDGGQFKDLTLLEEGQEIGSIFYVEVYHRLGKWRLYVELPDGDAIEFIKQSDNTWAKTPDTW